MDLQDYGKINRGGKSFNYETRKNRETGKDGRHRVRPSIFAASYGGSGSVPTGVAEF